MSSPAHSSSAVRANSALLASKRHTLIFVGLLILITAAGAYQSRRLSPAPTASSSRLALYAGVIVLQLVWLRYTQLGLKARGHTIIEFFRAGSMARDLAWAVVIFSSTQAFVVVVRATFGSVHANTAFLLPHGPVDSIVWVCVSIIAGISEEVAFRGYLQRQFTALMGKAGAAVVLQAVIFGVTHGYQGARAAVIATGYGLIFGIFAWRLKSVRAGAIAHAATDILVGLRLI